MFFANKIKVDPTLHKSASRRATELGYPSLDDFVAHLLERELKSAADQTTRDRVLQKMKGLGYLQ
jgi:hypothetical protein